MDKFLAMVMDTRFWFGFILSSVITSLMFGLYGSAVIGILFALLLWYTWDNHAFYRRIQRFRR